ncbi:HWE histidine kinase domain-containing protein [uncultured Brevundimonas sp.]|uniref:HWE histidine kinase domain-containing protein n=1 Tax=uncultured Brevundimonas sp. TaxID=213418 RepID=UPI0030EF40B4|tara:strand:+ start:5084 stop:6604 length:1521 start_codon:yes stop_codon:yes gene_type:complete
MLKKLADSDDLAVDLASAFDASPNPYMLITPDFRFAGMNAAYLEVTGSTRDALIGRKVFDVFDAGPTEAGRENSRQLRASFERVLETGQSDHLAVIRYAIPRAQPSGETRLEERYWSATHTPLRDSDGRTAFILQHTTDITELETLRRQTAGLRTETALNAIVGGDVLARAEHVQQDNRRLQSERNRLFDILMQAPGFIAVLAGPNHVFQMHNAAYAQLLGRSDLLGKTVVEAVPEVRDQGFVDMLDQIWATGESIEGRETLVQLRRQPDSPLETVYVDFIFQPIRDESARVVGILVQGHEVTDTVLAVERQRLMIDELNHRVKNTLATVQSIAMQTARTHIDPASFAEAFQARLMALSHTHDLLTRSHWEGAELRAILEHETEVHGRQRVLLNGPALALSPATALSLGMIFHELATNAAKFGALSLIEGRVLVDWTLTGADSSTLNLNWRELDGPPVDPPARRGFGSRLIERSVHHDLAGTIELRYPSAGLEAEISIPLYRGDPT